MDRFSEGPKHLINVQTHTNINITKITINYSRQKRRLKSGTAARIRSQFRVSNLVEISKIAEHMGGIW